MTPAYVPPHLVGKVGDFRNEEGGRVSFAHPEAAAGLGPDFSRQTVSREVYDTTFDRDKRYEDMGGALQRQYASPIAPGGQDPLSRMRDGLAGWLRSAADWSASTDGRAIGGSALLGALLAGGAGAYQAHRSGDPMLGRSLLAALAGASAGAGGMAYLRNRTAARRNYLQEKSASFADDIQQAMLQDSNLSRHELRRLLALVEELERADQQKLAQLLRSAAGAAAGAVVARFLGAKGLLSTVAGGMIGAWLTGGERPHKNKLGQLVS